MKLRFRFISTILGLLLASSAVFAVPLRADAARMIKLKLNTDTNNADFEAGELLVKFKRGTSDTTENTIHKKIKAKLSKKLGRIDVDKVKIPNGLTIEKAIRLYKKYREVEYVEPNYIRSATQLPNDPFYNDQWAFPKMNAPQAWDITTGDAGVVIAVIDTGVDYNHPDLSGKVIKGYDYVNGDTDPFDDEGHGTHVAGIAAATTNNGMGVAGMSWGSKVLAIKVLDASGNGTDANVANGITYAADHGAKVINLSLGGPGYSVTLANAVQYARSHGCIVLAAAGNEGDTLNRVHYPGALPNVLCVAATDMNDTQASYSNYGWYVDVAAPGGDDMNILASNGILSTYPGNNYAWAEGTSMATPYVAGLAALIAAKYPSRTADQIAWTIQEYAKDLGAAGRDDSFGFGRIDAEKSLEQNNAGLEEADGGITYTGSWSTEASTYASGGSYKSSDIIGSDATYTFNGTNIAWLAKTGPSSGIARVYLDGTSQGNIDLYAPQDTWQYLAFNASGLGSGNHTLRIEVTGTKNISSSGNEVTIDALDVVGATVSSMVSLPSFSASNYAFGVDTNILLAFGLALVVIGAGLAFRSGSIFGRLLTSRLSADR